MSKYRPVASFCLQGGAIQPEDGPDEVSRGGGIWLSATAFQAF